MIAKEGKIIIIITLLVDGDLMSSFTLLLATFNDKHQRRTTTHQKFVLLHSPFTLHTPLKSLFEHYYFVIHLFKTSPQMMMRYERSLTVSVREGESLRHF